MNAKNLLLPLILIVGAIFGYFIGKVGAAAVNKAPLQIEVDATISKGRIIEAYVNGIKRPPLFTSIIPGERHIYILGGVNEDIKSLRIDLGKMADAAIELREIRIRDNTGVRKRFDAAALTQQLQGKLYAVVGPLTIKEDSVSYIQRSVGPSLIFEETIVANSSPLARAFALIRQGPQSRDDLLRVFFGSFLAALIVSILFSRTQFVIVASCFFAVLLTYISVMLAYAVVDIPDPVSQSVGRAGYTGRSTMANRIAVLLSIVLTVIFALVSAAIARSKLSGAQLGFKANFVAGKEHDNSLKFRMPSLIGAFAVSVLIIGYFLAQVVPSIDAISASPLHNEWDSNNIDLWNYLIFRGHQPLLDFWFPYGGRAYLAAAPPWGQIANSMYYASTYVILFLAAYELLGRRVIAALAVLVFAIVGEQVAMFLGGVRYLAAINVVLSFAAMRQHEAVLGIRPVLFGLSVLLALIMEPTQLIYAAPSVFVKLILNLFDQWDRTLRPILGEVLKLLVSFFMGIAYIVFLMSQGLLKATIDFHLTLGALANYTSVPTDLRHAIYGHDLVYALALFGPIALIAMGVTGRFLANTQHKRKNYDTLIMFGLVGLMLYQKELIRDIAWMFLLPTPLGLLIWILQDRTFSHVALAPIFGMTVGFSATIMGETWLPSYFLHQIEHGPSLVLALAREFIEPTGRFERARNDIYGPKRLSGFSQSRELIAHLYQVNDGKDPRPAFVIGDDPMLYMLLDQKPPFHSNDYNASPIFEQKRIVEWLEKHQPQYAMWQSSDLHFDAFQRVVRNPIIYQEVVRRFIPVERYGSVAILRARRNDEPPDLAWWHHHLGSTIDFGHLMRGVRHDQYPACETGNRECAPFLIVDIAPRVSVRQIEIPIQVGEFTFKVALSIKSSARHYIIPFYRLWFWGAAIELGLAPRVDGANVDGVDARIESRRVNLDVLY